MNVAQRRLFFHAYIFGIAVTSAGIGYHGAHGNWWTVVALAVLDAWWVRDLIHDFRPKGRPADVLAD